jgi:two-component system sensor histidine kinase YesM
VNRLKKTDWSVERRLIFCLCLAAVFIVLEGTLLLVCVTHMTSWSTKTMNSIRFLTFILGILLISFLIFSYRFLVIPYWKVKRVLENFNKGILFDEIFSLPYKMSQDLDIALAKFEVLLDKKEMARISVEQSKYLALQNQISPHFLYNTLDAIRGDALMAGLENISDTLEALSAYFAYSISNLEQYATVMEEIRNVSDYITVQKYRFGESLKFKVEYMEDDPEYFETICIPRFVLQPIVENAIYHGLEVRDKRGSIRIRLQRTKTRLIIDVIDDGVGMSWNAVEVLNQKLVHAEGGRNAVQKKKGIALINVNSRIKLLFGHEYGLYVYSTEGVGTDVKMTLPITPVDEA